jgi:hypothetical protein
MSSAAYGDLTQLRVTLDATLRWSAARDFAGHNKHDALNSPLLEALCGWSRPTRLLAIQAVMRAPWNLRPWLGVRETRNPKGLGLFADAFLDRYRVDGDPRDLAAACRLLDALLERPASGFRGLSWGYQYPWQDVGFYAPRHFPNRVVTCWIGFAVISAARVTGERRYLDALPAIAEFLTEEPNVLFDENGMKAYSYVPSREVTWAVMDVPALVGAFLAEAGQTLLTSEYDVEARRLLAWVAEKQTADGAWFYTHPPGDSHIGHDNYHTAIILDCFDRYRAASGDRDYDLIYERGLNYYLRHLFAASGAPRFMSDREFPYDIHGAASGILCFVRAAEAAVRDGQPGEIAGVRRAQARRILDWTLTNLYDSEGFFYYQRTRWRTKRFCLMRWCNAWMARAMASLLRSAEAL